MTYNFAMNCQFNGPELDAIYQDAFGYKSNGWFAEVGASNGQDYSNTSGLADMGWNGLYVEPVAELARQCELRHKKNTRILTYSAGIGRANGFQKLWMIPAWGTCTSNKEAALKIDENSYEFTSNILTLNTVLMASGFPINFDLLVIDVDFGEIEVLLGFSIDHWKPKLVVIELHEDEHLPNPLSENIRQFANPYFTTAGYEKVYKDGINTIFKAKL
jgi:FkbM family methyltransferase